MMRIKKKYPIGIGITVLLLYVFFIFKGPILESFGRFLIRETKLTQADAIFVLSGGPKDRGIKAAELYKEAWAPIIICTGENKPHDFQAMGMEIMECQITRNQIRRSDIPDDKIELIRYGTSTKEEADTILNYSLSMNYDTIIIVSNKFHTRRIRLAMADRFSEKGIHLIIQGAPASSYDEKKWWKSENGLIALNNEYIKYWYYLIKY